MHKPHALVLLVLLQQAKATSSAAMAKKLAYQIKNPLQSLLQVAYLEELGQSDLNTKTLGQELSADLQRLFALVTQSLAQPANVLG